MFHTPYGCDRIAPKQKELPRQGDFAPASQSRCGCTYHVASVALAAGVVGVELLALEARGEAVEDGGRDRVAPHFLHHRLSAVGATHTQVVHGHPEFPVLTKFPEKVLFQTNQPLPSLRLGTNKMWPDLVNL